MSEWIIVRNDDKRPHLLGSNTSPFRVYGEGADPSEGGPQMDGTVEIVYLPVTRIAQPELENTILQQAVQQTTLGDNNIAYAGAYSAPEWVVGWNTVPQDIEVSRTQKTYLLDTARDARVAAGHEFNGGTCRIPLTKDWVSAITTHLMMFQASVEAGATGTNVTIWFDNTELVIGYETFRAQAIAFYQARADLDQTYAIALRDIGLAETPAEVDEVAWTFA
jgi:hypothetical protein